MGVPGLGQHPTQYTVHRGIPDIDDFVGLHFEHFITLGDRIPGSLVPAGNGAFDHFDAPLGHRDRIDIAQNLRPRCAAVS